MMNNTLKKHRFLQKIFVFAVVMASGVNVYNAQKSESLSDIALANVEALADGESDFSAKIWNREDYKLDNGTPAANCWSGGSSDCILR